MTMRNTGDHPDLKMVNPNAAAIDIGSTMHMAAVNADTDIMPVRAFGTCTQDLHALAAWFKSCGVTSVAMESTDVYWIPAFEILEGECLKLCVSVIWSMLPERSKDDDDFQRSAGRVAKGLQAA